MTIFNIEQDRQQIEAGTHFWCESCVIARPNAEQSADLRYCQGCHDRIMDDADQLPKRRRWTPSDWKPQRQDATDPQQDAPDPQDVRTIKGDVENDLPPAVNPATVIMSTTPKGTRGRPRKDNAEVCDRTLRRRAAEDRQAVMF